MTVLALLHSPLTSADAWGQLPAVLGEHGWRVVVPSVNDDDTPPYAQRYVARAASQLHASLDVDQEATAGEPLVLVGHSGAGPLLAQVAFARRAAGHPAHGYLFLDAGLPRPTNARNRLDLMRIEDPDFAATLQAHLAAGERFPDWASDDLAEEIPNPGDRALLLAGLRPRGLDYFTEELPLAEDWPDAPVAYLQLSAPYDQPAATARRRGWATRSLGLGHFAAISHPQAVAQAMTELLRG